MLKLYSFLNACILYAIFFLGSVPLPPAPGRLSLEESTGASRYPEASLLTEALASAGKATSGYLVLALLVLLFALFVRVMRKPNAIQRTLLYRAIQFSLLLTIGFVAADYSRELAVTNLEEYAKARIDWIKDGAKMGYPRWTSVYLKKALISRDAAELDGAFEAVAIPALGKIPAYPALSAACKRVYRDRIEGSSGLSADRPGDPNSPFACRLLEFAASRLGRDDFSDPNQCYAGPLIKVLYALELQGFSCRLESLPNKPAAKDVCPKFLELVGTDHFQFCKPESSS